jgi:hypothetical protein
MMAKIVIKGKNSNIKPLWFGMKKDEPSIKRKMILLINSK